ncbi:MAG: 30S ribosomal protein S9 [Parcubacteria group bacterium]|jgi:small subunit ribosomal protein S9|nr:30S ribosomal protein S9 [Parcubacteria group bacterium]|tara:strand:+ start:27765 stop:28259 length:495 start_codon:yes stop_codon:yes gene_type:complete
MPETKKTTKKPAIKKKVKKAAKKEAKKEKTPVVKASRYFQAVGRRKTSVARIRLFTKGEREFLINKKPYKTYFPTHELQEIVTSAFIKMNCFDKFKIVVLVKGGGIHSQAQAVRHAVSRALVEFNPDFRKKLRKAGYLTRDPRMRERKKFGLKRARKAPQWAKR